MFEYNIKDIDCILCRGQSNEEGGDSATTPSITYLNSQPHTTIFYKPDATSTDNGSIQYYNNALNSNYRSNKYPAADCSVGIKYNELTGKPLMIIKYALGGSALVDDGVTTTMAGLWQIDANATRANNLLHYDISINNFIIPCIEQAKRRGIRLNIIADCWMQGESDAQLLARATSYESELIRLFDATKTTLTPYGVLSSNFKPLITRIHDNFSPARPYQNEIRAALENVANHYGGQLIDSDSYSLAADLIHYNATGQIQHGIDRAIKLANYYQ